MSPNLGRVCVCVYVCVYVCIFVCMCVRENWIVFHIVSVHQNILETLQRKRSYSNSAANLKLVTATLAATLWFHDVNWQCWRINDPFWDWQHVVMPQGTGKRCEGKSEWLSVSFEVCSAIWCSVWGDLQNKEFEGFGKVGKFTDVWWM